MAATAITAVPFRTERHCFCFPQGKLRDGMSRFKPHIALLICNIVWAMDYPFYNIVLPHYVHPMAMVAGSLVVTALFSLVPLLWQKAERVARADIRKLARDIPEVEMTRGNGHAES